MMGPGPRPEGKFEWVPLILFNELSRASFFGDDEGTEFMNRRIKLAIKPELFTQAYRWITLNKASEKHTPEEVSELEKALDEYIAACRSEAS
jgi:hypothetical protein